MVPAKDVPQRSRLELSPPDKPLPGLPIVTVQAGSPVIRRSLIDAREKPLRRSISPAPGANADREWPVLVPTRPTTPSAVQEIPSTDPMKHMSKSTDTQPEPSLEVARCDHQHIDKCQWGSKATAADHRLQQGNTFDVVAIEKARESDQASMASETTTKTLNSENNPLALLSNAEQSLITADGEPSESKTSTESGCPKECIPEEGLSINDYKPSSSTGPKDGVVHKVEKSSSQAGVRARASRLPKRLSAPGPVRNSSSPCRSGSRGTSPYGPLPAPICRNRYVKDNHHSSSPRRQDDRAKSLHAGQAAHSVNLAIKNVPSSVAVKKSSKHGVAESCRRSIPRPRSRSELDEDAESESEVLLSKLPRRKLNSNPLTSEHKAEDGDIDTDEGHEQKEGPLLDASVSAAQNNQSGDNSDLEAPITVFKGQTDSSAMMPEDLASLNPAGLLEEEKALSGALDKEQHPTQSKADCTSTFKPQVDVARQRQLLDKPFNRFKRLSATAPDHGPVLRISDSAERIIMGSGSDGCLHDHDTAAQKRNSVPDLRRSVVIKELRKSTEGLLNGLSPLSRGLTTRSLNGFESKDVASENKDESMSLRSELCSPKARLNTLSFDDPFSTTNGKSLADSDNISRRCGAGDAADWPLRTSAQAANELQPVDGYKAEDEKSWISPLQVSHGGAACDHERTSSFRNGEGN